MRAAGVPVDVQVDGDLAGLPAGVDLAAYRIVQEALTNVLKHAGPATARVRRAARPAARWRSRSATTAAAAAPAPADGGTGWSGMRERAALYGGTVEAGSRPGGGYRVRARLLVDGVAAMTIRVLVVDDEELVRTGLRMILDAEPDLTVVGTAADGRQAVTEVRRLSPGRRPDGHPDARRSTGWRRPGAS